MKFDETKNKRFYQPETEDFHWEWREFEEHDVLKVSLNSFDPLEHVDEFEKQWHKELLQLRDRWIYQKSRNE